MSPAIRRGQPTLWLSSPREMENEKMKGGNRMKVVKKVLKNRCWLLPGAWTVVQQSRGSGYRVLHSKGKPRKIFEILFMRIG